MRRWIRLDAEWEESGWLHGLSGEAAGCWPRLLCWVKLRGKAGRCRFPSAAVLAHQWRVAQPVVETLLAGALEHGAIAKDGNDLLVVNWEEYQEPDRTGAERQARWRERDRNGVTPVTGRDALSMSMSMSGVAGQGEGLGKGEPKGKKRWRFVPDEWMPNDAHRALAAQFGVDLDAEEGKFRDHEFKDPKSDADRAFSRWLRNAKGYSGRGRPDANTRLRDKTWEAAEELRRRGLAS